jgi:hypothetical protein
MEKLLNFKIPEKIRKITDHNEMYESDSGVDGSYVPNMSDEDKCKWKAKHIKGDDECIEIRKTFGGVQLLVIVYKKPYQPEKPQFPEYDGGGKSFYWEAANVFYRADCKRYGKRHQNVRISMNGKLDMTWCDWQELHDVIDEALDIIS